MTLVFCALDTPNLPHAVKLARMIGPITGALKIGLELWSAQGPKGVEAVAEACPDAKLFLDLKFHDIPATVAGAVGAVCRAFAPAYLNVHTSGGLAMMTAAKAAATASTRILGVTVLTSLNAEALNAVGQGLNVATHVLRLARLAADAGLDGVVCAAYEAHALRSVMGADFDLIVPGIRPTGTTHDDQVRVMSPSAAIAAGATHLVIGRPITAAADPAKAAMDILACL